MAGVVRRRDRILLLIALARWAKAAVLLGAGVLAFRLLRPGAAEQVSDWLTALPFTTEERVGQRALRWLLGAGPRRVQLLGLSAFAYAALFAVEGTGLWMQKRWAEYFSIVATSSLLPLETTSAGEVDRLRYKKPSPGAWALCDGCPEYPQYHVMPGGVPGASSRL